jgi:hypothetical protein
MVWPSDSGSAGIAMVSADASTRLSAWAPLNPEYPVVWFDRQKRVIDKFDFASP